MPKKNKNNITVSPSTPPELRERFIFPDPAWQGGANDIQPLPGLVLKVSITGINDI